MLNPKWAAVVKPQVLCNFDVSKYTKIINKPLFDFIFEEIYKSTRMRDQKLEKQIAVFEFIANEIPTFDENKISFYTEEIFKILEISKFFAILFTSKVKSKIQQFKNK